MTSRREFVKQAVYTGASLVLLDACQKFSSADAAGVDPEAIDSLRRKFKGSLLTSADQDYELARRVASWNPRMDKRPLLIARCINEDDVMRSIEFAQEHRLLASTRSGGHSFQGWSTCDGGAIIDLSLMKNISIDPKTQTARVGAGVRAEELVAAAAQHGLAPVLGECGNVGVAGLTLGGGLGWLSGKFGAACDNLRSARLVTTGLKAVEVSGITEPELFWGLRGGGGNFGIATSLEVKLHKIGEVYAGGFSYPLREAREILHLFGQAMASAPDELQGLAYLYRQEKGEVHVIMVYNGESDEGAKLLKPFSSRSAVVRNTMALRPYTKTFVMPPYGEFRPTTFGYTRGTYIEALNDQAIEVALASFENAGPNSAIGFDHYMHGEVCRAAPEATAFNLRAQGGLHGWIAAAWNDAAEADGAMAWAEESWKRMQDFTGGRIYANYTSEDGDLAKKVFGPDTRRLAALKKKYDPDNFFRLNHNIRPA